MPPRPGSGRESRSTRTPSDRFRPDQPGRDPQAARPLLVTADEVLLDDLLRLSAVAGLTPEVVSDAGSAARPWRRAPLVLVGADLADTLAAAGVPPRNDVVLVSSDLDDGSVWQRAVAVGAQHVAVLPDGEPWLIERLADLGDDRGGPGAIVAVVGGRGGAGASVLAAALAITARGRSGRVMLVDADPLGGGLDLLLGGEHTTGLRWPDLIGTRGRVDADALYAALPRVDELSLLSWDRSESLSIPPGVMREILAAGRRGCDLTVVDLPRRLDGAVLEVLGMASTTLLIVPAEIRATAAAARVAVGLAAADAQVQVVVRGPAPSGLPATVIASSLGLPLIGELQAEPHVAEALERGEPPARRGRGPLAQFCGRFLDDLSLATVR